MVVATIQKRRWLVTVLELQVCAWALPISCLSSLNPASIFQRALDLDDLHNGQGQVRQRLGWEPGILNRPSRRPKGMHQRTFELLKAQHDVFVNAAVAEMAKRLRLME
jgi:hypothetical protein